MQTVTLQIPDSVFRWAERAAATTKRPVESVLVSTLVTTAPPPLDDAPPELRSELESLERLPDRDLLAVAHEQFSPAQIRRYDQLLGKSSAGTLTVSERGRLDTLRQEAGRIMLRRARAYVLLKWRGYSTGEMLGGTA